MFLFHTQSVILPMSLSGEIRNGDDQRTEDDRGISSIWDFDRSLQATGNRPSAYIVQHPDSPDRNT